MRRLLSLLMASVLCFVCVSCATGNALRVESPAPTLTKPTPTLDQQSLNAEAEQWEQPYSPAKVRQLLLKSDLSAAEIQRSNAEDIDEYLSTCAECVISLPPHEAGGERFQIYSLSTMSDSYSFASFAIRDNHGTPELALAVGGEDVYLSSGKDGTLVAQEAIYQSQDPTCCPSGWSVRLYRYQNGKFVEADHFTSKVDPAQSEGDQS